MDRIEPRIHDEIKDYKEKFYNFTLRQWIFGILILITTVPLYLLLSPRIGSNLTGWIVIIVAVPIGFVGFIPIQGLNAEKIIFFWKRNYINFAKPILYKSSDSLSQSKNNLKRVKKSSSVSKKEQKLEKLKQKELQKERKRQREIARAKKKFGINNLDSTTSNFSLSQEEAQVLLKFAKQVIGKEENSNEPEVKEETKVEESNNQKETKVNS